LLGSGMTAAFGSELDFAERIRIASALARSGLTQEGQAIAAVAAVEGDDAARAYGEALNLDEETIEAAVAAGKAIRENAPVSDAEAAGDRVGGGFIGGFVSGLQSRLEQVRRV